MLKGHRHCLAYNLLTLPLPKMEQQQQQQLLWGQALKPRRAGSFQGGPCRWRVWEHSWLRKGPCSLACLSWELQADRGSPGDEGIAPVSCGTGKQGYCTWS